MKLVSFIFDNPVAEVTPRVGALSSDGEWVLDFRAGLGIDERGSGHSLLPDLLAWFDLDGALLSPAQSLYSKIAREPKLLSESHEEWSVLRRADVRLLAPVPRPGKLIAIGLNYRDHAIESNLPIPERPVVFSKFTTAVIGPEQPIILPVSSAQVDYEAELAVVIGRRAKNVPRERAMDHVLGYTNFNDVSARDFQFSDGQWQRGKSCDTFAPMGPYLVTKDEIPNPHNLTIKLRLNGQTMQDSNTDQLIFDIPELIAFLSETITLEPGDVIVTGTPPGVGFARKPPVFLQRGDLVEVEIEGLGALANCVY